jgi:hypothetical protein
MERHSLPGMPSGGRGVQSMQIEKLVQAAKLHQTYQRFGGEMVCLLPLGRLSGGFFSACFPSLEF